ncbi:MAG: hypothetical protein JWP12_131 [Bacteroidetes bacterium]|nr:hypothetical protein [Bacteroidota bacterium]
MQKNKKLRRFLSILLILFVMIGLFGFFAGPVIKNKIINSVHKSSNGVYEAKIDHISFDPFTFTYELHGFELSFDSVSAKRSILPLLVNIKCPVLKFEGMSLVRTFLSNSFNIDKLIATDTMDAGFYINSQTDTTASKKGMAISLFSVNRIDVPGIRFKLYNLKTGKLILTTHNVSFAGNDLSVDLAGRSAFGKLEMNMEGNHLLSDKQDRFVKQLSVKLEDKVFRLMLDSVESKNVINTIGHRMESNTGLDYNFELKKLDIEVNDLFGSINALQNYEGARFYVEKIHLYDPMITISDKPNRVVTEESMEKKEQAKAFISPFLFHKIIVENGKLTYKNSDGQTSFTIKKIDCSIDELCLNENYKVIPFDFTNVNCTASDIEMGGLKYKIKLKQLLLDRRSETLILKGLSVAPVQTPDVFFEQAKYQVAYFKLDKTDIDLKGFIFSTIDSTFAGCRSIVVNHPEISVLKNKAYQWNTNDNQLLLHELIRRIPTNVKSDTIQVRNGNITYRELNLKGNGEVTLKNVYVTATNFSTIKVKSNKNLKIAFAAKLYGAIELTANIDYPLNGDGTHTITGKLGSGDLTVFNAYLEQIYGAKIISGRLRSCTFAATFFNKKSTGWMQPEYENLKMDISKVELPDKEKDDQKKGLKFLKKMLRTNKNSQSAFLQQLTNALANSVVYSNNIAGKEALRKGVIAFDRRTYKPFLNFWVVSLVQGFLDAITPVKVKFE